MEDTLSGIAALAVLGFMFWFIVWLLFLLPADMARDRNRSPFAWVLISLIFSPFLAILLLIVLGDAED